MQQSSGYKMKLTNYRRFLKDINYDLLIPPLGLDYYNMTPKQAKENFEWFMSKKDERTEYLIERCSEDIGVSIDKLDFSAESLIILWEWFLKIARIEKTPKEELEKMIEGAKIFGESFINYEQFTVVTKFIMIDIGIYMGECYVKNYKQLYWSYKTKPKHGVSTNIPIIKGFKIINKDKEYDWFYDPINNVEACASNIFTNTQYTTELYEWFVEYTKNIPTID